jgi:hypothetical protein
MHTDATLAILDIETTKIGDQLRQFQSTTCAAFKTHELGCEKEARERRKIKQSKPTAAPDTSKQVIQERKTKSLNLKTYKFHAMGDYVSSIKQFGTTDSYTTAIVSYLQASDSIIG